MISGLADGTVKLWDLKRGNEVVPPLLAHGACVTAVALDARGRRAVTASEDGTVKVWDVISGWDARSGQELRRRGNDASPVHCVAMSPDGRIAVLPSSNGAVGIWDLETRRERRFIEGHTEAVTGVAVSPDGTTIASASLDSTVQLRNLESGQRIAKFTCDAPALCCAFFDDRTLLAGDGVGRVHFLCLETGRRKLNTA